MIQVQPGDSVAFKMSVNGGSGVTNADSTPTVSAYKNNTLDSTLTSAITIASDGTSGGYNGSFTVPATYSAKDDVEIVGSCTIGGVTYKNTVWKGRCVLNLFDDLVGYVGLSPGSVSAGATSVPLASNADSAVTDAYKGRILIVYSSPHRECYWISGYNFSTQTLTISKALVYPLSTNDKLMILDLPLAPVDSTGAVLLPATAPTGYGPGSGLSLSGADSDVVDTGVLAAVNNTTPTVTLASSAPGQTNVLNTCRLKIMSGTGLGQTRTIVSYTSGRVATLDRPFSVAPAAGATYAVMYATNAPLNASLQTSCSDVAGQTLPSGFGSNPMLSGYLQTDAHTVGGATPNFSSAAISANVTQVNGNTFSGGSIPATLASSVLDSIWNYAIGSGNTGIGAYFYMLTQNFTSTVVAHINADVSGAATPAQVATAFTTAGVTTTVMARLDAAVSTVATPAQVATALTTAGVTTTVMGRLDAAISTIATPAQVLTQTASALASAGVNTTVMGYINGAGGQLASHADVTGIQNNTDLVFSPPSQIVVPATGTTPYLLDLFFYDENGNMLTPTSAPTLHLTNAAGTSLDSRLAATTLTLFGSETGHYQTTYTSTSTDNANDELNFKVSVTFGGKTKLYGRTSFTTGSATSGFTSSDRTTLSTIATAVGSGTGVGISSAGLTAIHDALISTANRLAPDSAGALASNNTLSSTQVHDAVISTATNRIAVDGSGQVGQNNAPSTTAIHDAIISNANKLAPDASGLVGANNLPTDYQQRTAAVILPTTPPTGYGGPTTTAIHDAIISNANKLAPDASGLVGANNLPTDYQQRTSAVILPTTAPSGYGGASAAAVAAAILVTPGNLLNTDSSGKVGANNLPADYQQRAVAVTLPTTAPSGYGGATAAACAAAILVDSTKKIFTGSSGGVALDQTGLDGLIIEVTNGSGGMNVNARQTLQALGTLFGKQRFNSGLGTYEHLPLGNPNASAYRTSELINTSTGDKSVTLALT